MKIQKLVSMKNCIAALVVGSRSRNDISSSRFFCERLLICGSCPSATRPRLDVRARRFVAPWHALSWIPAGTADTTSPIPNNEICFAGDSDTAQLCDRRFDSAATFEAWSTFHRDGKM